MVVCSLLVIPPINEEIKQLVQDMGQRLQSVQQSADRVAQMGNMVQDYALYIATQASSIQTGLSNVAPQSCADFPPTTQGRNDPTKSSKLRP